MEQPEVQSPENDDYGKEEDVAVNDGEFPDADVSDTAEIDATEDPKSQNIEDTKKRLEKLEDEAGALREMQAKVEQEIDADVSDTAEIDAVEDPKSQNLKDTKKRLVELEDEAGALREMQAKVEQDMGVSQVAAGTNKAASSGTSLNTRKLEDETENVASAAGTNKAASVGTSLNTRKLENETENVAQSTSANPTQDEKEEVDARSIYVGNEEIDPAVRVQAAPPAAVGFVPHKPWICTLCKKCTIDRDNLETHIKVCHRNCYLCPTVSCSTVYRTGAAHICVKAYVLYQGDYIRVDVGEEGN